jgi:hypothetical protein
VDEVELKRAKESPETAATFQGMLPMTLDVLWRTATESRNDREAMDES